MEVKEMIQVMEYIKDNREEMNDDYLCEMEQLNDRLTSIECKLPILLERTDCEDEDMI